MTSPFLTSFASGFQPARSAGDGSGPRLERLARAWLLAAAVALWALAFGPSLAAHVKNATNPYLFANDARANIWPFLRFRDQGLFPDDFIGRYYLAARFPLGYRTLFTTLAPVVDPSALSKVLPYLLLSATIAALALASERLGGPISFLAAGALCLSSRVFLHQVGGALPRAFAFPVLAAALWALMAGRAWLLVAAILCGAAFYPPAAVAPGLALAFWFFFLPERDRGEAQGWNLRRRLIVVAATAFTSALVVLPMTLGGRAYGRLIKPSDVAMYPEAGPGGRYSPANRAPFPGLLESIDKYTREALHGDGEPFSRSIRMWAERGKHGGHEIVAGLVLVLLAGLFPLCAKNAAARRLLALVAAVVVAHAAARLLAPYLYLPQRHLHYAVPLLVLCLLPASAAALAGLTPGRVGVIARPIAAFLVAAVCLACFGARIQARNGLSIEVHPSEGVYSFLSALPKAALVAGYPSGIIENVPYVCRRRIFLARETHEASHTAYVEEMRRRMRAFVTAYFASDTDPIVRLRDEFGVTHLVVDRNHFGSEAPTYFKPFNEAIWTAHAEERRRGFAVLEHSDAWSVFSKESILVLDLSRLSGSSLGGRHPRRDSRWHFASGMHPIDSRTCSAYDANEAPEWRNG